ncbi:response regulator [Marispirochaeta aestuarii]|uniref:response regulator n=1 Tax=Marispirochaeta aestuarii TaxID=1963862 RepID=UPI0029C654C8|nr:response regulator [Marispirochaeta aestuarii]
MGIKVILVTLTVVSALILGAFGLSFTLLASGLAEFNGGLLISAIQMSAVSLMIVCTLLFFVFAFLSRLRLDHLYFGFFSLAAVVYSLLRTIPFFSRFYASVSLIPLRSFEFILLAIGGILLSLFFHQRYQRRVSLKLVLVYSILNIALGLAWFLGPRSAAVYMENGITGLSGALFLYLLVRLVPLIREKLRVLLHIIGLLAVSAAGICDLLLLRGLVESVYLLPAALLVFVFLHVLVQFLTIREDYASLRTMDKRIQAADRLKDEFLSNMSHELRTPIHAVVGLSESLLRGNVGEMTEDQKSTLSLVFSSGLRLNAMVSDILDFSRMREGRIQLQNAEVDLYQSVLVAQKMCVPLLMGGQLSIKNNIVPHSLFIWGDENRIEQSLNSILMSIIKFSSQGTIEIDAREDNRVMVISIALTGGNPLPGNIVEGRDDDFKEPGCADEGYKGVNLGLSLARRLIEAQSGSLEYSVKDDTSLFQVTLPSTRGRYQGEAGEQEESLEISLDALENLEALNDDNTEASKFTIVVVDDNPVNLQVLKNQLSGEEFRIVPFLNGEKALAHILNNPPDLVLLDIMMPEIDGYTLCRKVREKYTSTDLPIVLVTAKSEAMDMEEGLSAGANDFLAKPYTQEELLARIRTHLNLAKINTIYSRFVPMEFIDFLGHDNIADIQLGDQVQKEMTVLFVDIRAFTALSEIMTPQENFKFINSFLSRLSPMIQENGGIIDKYIGDSIMALFPNRPEDAIKAATEMVGHMEIYNKQRASCGYRPISIGVGIHTGNLILGIIGDKGRMQGTVISDAVNLASRIQDVTKLYGANIIISQESFIKLDNPTEYGFRFLGKVRVKGKNRSVSLFEIFDGDQEEMRELKTETKTDFETAILQFSKRQFDESAELFRQIIAVNSEDRAARLFLEKAEAFIAQEKRRFLFSG